MKKQIPEIEQIEKIDILRLRRFPCEKCVLTKEAQYKIIFAEAVNECNGKITRKPKK